MHLPDLPLISLKITLALLCLLILGYIGLAALGALCASGDKANDDEHTEPTDIT